MQRNQTFGAGTVGKSAYGFLRLLTVAVLLNSCASSERHAQPLSPLKLHRAGYLDDIRARMIDMKGIGDSSGGGKNCADTLALAVRGPMPQEWLDAHVTDAEDCFSTDLLAEGFAATLAPQDIEATPIDQKVVKDLVERLDLASFRSSLRPRFSIGDDGPFRLARIKARAPAKIRKNLIELDLGNDWYFSIIVLASGKIGRYPRALLIKIVDQSLEGTYLSATDFIVPITPDGPLPVVDVIEEWRHTRVPPLPSLTSPPPK